MHLFIKREALNAKKQQLLYCYSLLSSICLSSIQLMFSTLKSTLLPSCSLKAALLSGCTHSWQTQLACWAHSAVRWRNSNSSPSLCCSLSFFSFCLSLPDDFAAVSLICFSAARRFPFLPHCSALCCSLCMCVCVYAHSHTLALLCIQSQSSWSFDAFMDAASLLSCAAVAGVAAAASILIFQLVSRSQRAPQNTHTYTYICMYDCMQFALGFVAASATAAAAVAAVIAVVVVFLLPAHCCRFSLTVQAEPPANKPHNGNVASSLICFSTHVCTSVHVCMYIHICIYLCVQSMFVAAVDVDFFPF